jgi:hypothetical protein
VITESKRPTVVEMYLTVWLALLILNFNLISRLPLPCEGLIIQKMAVFQTGTAKSCYWEEHVPGGYYILPIDECVDSEQLHEGNRWARSRDNLRFVNDDQKADGTVMDGCTFGSVTVLITDSKSWLGMKEGDVIFTSNKHLHWTTVEPRSGE